MYCANNCYPVSVFKEEKLTLSVNNAQLMKVFKPMHITNTLFLFKDYSFFVFQSLMVARYDSRERYQTYIYS